MKTKILGVILLIVGITMITFGLIPIFNGDNSKKVYSSKCLNDVCIENFNVSVDGKIYYVNADLRNSSQKLIENRYINIVLEFEDGVIQKDTYQIHSLDGKEKIKYESYFSKDDSPSIDKVIDFIVENSSETDVMEFNSQKETDSVMG